MANRDKIEDVLMNAVDMLTDKIANMVSSKKELNIDEIGCISDIVKDTAETYKNVAKAHAIYATHAPEKY